MSYNKKVSVCMMVKNEEKNLHRCLKSLKPIINSGLAELIIIDTGSDDNSVNIAKEYTDKVYQHPWTNDFAEMRNKSISYASGEWIWIMDADEEIENPEEMIKLFQSDLTKYNTITITMKNYIAGKNENEENDFNICILNRGFRNSSGFRYEGKIHEQPVNRPPYLKSAIIFGHYGYLWDSMEFRQRKFERTTTILKKELEKNPNNIYYQFQLAVSCAIVNYEVGLTEMRKAYELVKKLSYKEKVKYIYIFGVYAKIAFANKKYIEIIKFCKEGLEINKDYIDLWYYLALANVSIGEEEDSLIYFIEYLKCKERFLNTQISKDPAFTFYTLGDNYVESALYNVCVIYTNRGDFDTAVSYLNKMKPSELKSKIVARVVAEEKWQNLLGIYLMEIEGSKNLLKGFFEILESNKYSFEKKVTFAKEIIEFYLSNIKVEDEYYLLNQVRLCVANNIKIDKDITNKLMMMDFSSLPTYYGDIVAYIIIQGLDIEVLAHIGDRDNLNRFLNYIITNYKNIHEHFVSYLLKYENTIEIKNLRSWISLAGNVLLTEKLEDESYKDIFQKYIDKGITYTRRIYNPEVLEEEGLYDVNKGEHRFFLYLERAYRIKKTDLKIYVQYLRKALKEHPIKKGVELLLNEIKVENHNRNINNVTNEFEEYKKKIKKNIDVLINQNMLQEAKELLKQYKNIVKNDVDIFSIKGVISIMEGEYKEAEKMLLDGISIQNDNFDLHYNLAYLYEITGRQEEAYQYYTKALSFGRKDMESAIKERLKVIGELENKNLQM
ncbi:glycosyltransferase family 2 protein [Clostridium thermarum]|uniref:glycosyltransferase family 2 protein n=1 Tax=Clostridium thermarum TaxID=1716543 RepID=UPI0013D03ECC|nr:glycosyltransferase family 2 protein [Clostridium thermarum]